MSSIPLPTLPSRLHPRGIVFGNGHHFEFFPGGNRVCTAVAFLICEELSDEVDVTIVRYLLELFDSVEGDVLLDEVAIRRVISFDDLLFFSQLRGRGKADLTGELLPPIQIPNSRSRTPELSSLERVCLP